MNAPISASRQTGTQLNALLAQREALRCIQAKSAAQLDSLLRAILDRVFQGKM